MVEVFVSYKREERPRIAPLVEALRNQGREVWIDAATKVSASFIVEINRALDNCRCAIVFWSRHSVRSNWVLSEAYTAYEKEKLIPVMLDNIVLPAPFNLLQAVDLTRWNGDFNDASWHELTHTVANYCGAPDQRLAVGRRSKPPMPNASSAAKSDSRSVQSNGSLNLKNTNDLAKLIVKYVEDAGGATASARIAQSLRAEYPEIENFNWFGHPTFRDLFNSLNIEGLLFEVAPPGIVRLKRSDAQVQIERQRNRDAMVAEVFELTEAPLLTEQEFRSTFFAIAGAISDGKSSRSSIAKGARDALARMGINISRSKIDYIITGAIFGGTEISKIDVTGIEVGKAFARTLVRQCGAHGWFVDDTGVAVVLQILGLSEVPTSQIAA